MAARPFNPEKKPPSGGFFISSYVEMGVGEHVQLQRLHEVLQRRLRLHGVARLIQRRREGAYAKEAGHHADDGASHAGFRRSARKSPRRS